MNMLVLSAKVLLLVMFQVLLIRGLISLMPWLAVRFTEVFLPIKSLDLRDRQAPERLSMLSLLFVISLILILKLESFILNLSLPFLGI